MLGLREAVAASLLAFLALSLVLRSRRPKVPIWALMALASSFSVAFGLIGLDELGQAVNIEVVLFLVGMFSIVALAESSGLLEAASLWFVSRFRSRKAAVVSSAYLFGLMAALAVNDTVALIGPPIAVLVARALGVDYRMVFLLLAYSLTIGSVMTPIGSPQNMLIAVESGIRAPFVEFLKWLAIPTLINIYLTAAYLLRVFRVEDRPVSLLALPQEKITNRRDAYLGGFGLAAVVAALLVNDLLQLAGLPHVKSIGFIPFVVAATLYVASSDPRRIIGGVDWGTVVFFISMFITMEAVWRAGVLQRAIGALILNPLAHTWVNVLLITLASLALSQLLSNVPFTKFFIDYMKALGFGPGNTAEWVALAMAATIAGNLTILGAASNVIVIETLETRYQQTISFTEFLKHGAVVTAINTAVYLAYFYLLLHL